MRYRNLIAILLILVGITVVFIPTMSEYFMERKIKSLNKDFTEDIAYDDIIKNLKSKAKFDYDAVRDISTTQTLLSLNKVDKNLIIGQLVVPSIDLNLPIFKGLNNTTLLAGTATMREDQTMGKGNYPIAGHYIKNKDILFGSLMDIKKEDRIKITDKKTIFEYRVYKILVVEDTKTDIIEDKEEKVRGKPVISLMTCYYSSKTGKRYFVLGELRDQYPYEEKLIYN